jgi:hypothetical protein
MPSAPKVQILYRRNGDILFGWLPLSSSEAKSYNLYSCATQNGVYTLVKNIKNITDKTYKKVVTYVKDSDIPIPDLTDYYFKLTFIDGFSVESNIALSVITTAFPACVKPNNFENEAEEANNHNYGWIDERKRWEKIKLTPDGKLKVDASVDIGDITLGSVQIATLPDDITKKYILVDSQRRSVISEDPTVFSRFQKFEEHQNVVNNVETTILTYTNVNPFFVTKVCCSGTADAKFNFKINNVVTQVLRNSWNNRNITFDFESKSLLVPANSTITVTTTHSEINAQDFEVSLYGFVYTY